MKRSFASLSPQEALHIAIFVEERNAGIYRQFAEMFDAFDDQDSREIAAVFEEMADEERTHGTLLQERYLERYGAAPCAVTEQEVRELIELPKLQSNIFAIARAGATAVPRNHALEVALAAEQGAMRFYQYLAETSDEPDLRAFYAELANFETDHTDELRRKIEQEKQAASASQA